MDLMGLSATLDLMTLISLGVDMVFGLPALDLCARPSSSSKHSLTLQIVFLDTYNSSTISWLLLPAWRAARMDSLFSMLQLQILSNLHLTNTI
jgi:hypothetical protein